MRFIWRAVISSNENEPDVEDSTKMTLFEMHSCIRSVWPQGRRQGRPARLANYTTRVAAGWFVTEPLLGEVQTEKPETRRARVTLEKYTIGYV